MNHNYLRSDWDVISFTNKEGTVVTEGPDFDRAMEFHLDETKTWNEKISYDMQIFSVNNNIRNEVFSIGDIATLTNDKSPYEEIRTLPTRNLGKITYLWTSFEQMRIDVGNGGYPMSEITSTNG